MGYRLKRFSTLQEKEYSWLGDAWNGIKNTVRYWWHTPGERDAIAHGEDPKKVKGFWANYRPRWNSFKESAMMKLAPWYYAGRANYLMKDHDERYGGKLPLGQTEEGEQTEYSVHRFYSIQPGQPGQASNSPYQPQGQSSQQQPGQPTAQDLANAQRNIQNQQNQLQAAKINTQSQLTQRDIQLHQFQLQREAIRTARQRQKLMEQERRDRLKAQQIEMKANQEKDKQTDSQTTQAIKNSQQQSNDAEKVNNVPLYKERTEAVRPKSMK